MNKVFNFSRFGKYFLYDLRNAKDTCGISTLLCGIAPLIIFVIFELFAVIFRGHMTSVHDIGVVGFAVGLGILLLVTPAKAYGRITEKAYGSNYLLIPASTFEKWLSMVLVLIVIPVIMLVIFYITNSLLSLSFPQLYLSSNLGSELPTEINIVGIVIVSCVITLWFFTLGALVFKKVKIAKTILASFALETLFVIIFALFNWNVNFDYFVDLEEMSGERFISVINWIVSIYAIVANVILLGAMYLRLKSIKH